MPHLTLQESWSNGLRTKGFPVLDWPPYSPDLNPIEHVRGLANFLKRFIDVCNRNHVLTFNVWKLLQRQIANLNDWQRRAKTYIDKYSKLWEIENFYKFRFVIFRPYFIWERKIFKSNGFFLQNLPRIIVHVMWRSTFTEFNWHKFSSMRYVFVKIFGLKTVLLLKWFGA